MRVLPPTSQPVGATPRRKASPQRRSIVLAAQGGRCAICADLLDKFEVDHIKPLFLGGWDTDDNCRALCIRCHKFVTKRFAKTAAKIRRILARMTGERRARRPILGRGFGRSGLVRGVDGKVRER